MRTIILKCFLKINEIPDCAVRIRILLARESSPFDISVAMTYTEYNPSLRRSPITPHVELVRI